MSQRVAAVLILTLILLAGVALSFTTLALAASTNGALSFPLDDAWIHLQFARNLADFGSFSFFRDKLAISGSTSPLYDFLLALGFFFTRNELLLGYLFGLTGLLASSLLFYRLTRIELEATPAAARPVGEGELAALFRNQFRDQLEAVGRDAGDGESVLGRTSPGWLLALGGALLVVIEPRLQWVALSGMETTFFTALLLGTMYAWRRRRWNALGVCAGLLLWTRPEGLLLPLLLFVDFAVHRWWVRDDATDPWTALEPAARYGAPSSSPTAEERGHGFPGTGPNGLPAPRDTALVMWRVAEALVPFLVIAAGYAAFNLTLSGTLFPNTLAAKTRFDAAGGDDFPAQALDLLAGGYNAPLAVAALVGAGAVVVGLSRRRAQPTLLHLLWVVALFFAYWIELSTLHENGRYLLPAVPSVIALALYGIAVVSASIIKRFDPRREAAEKEGNGEHPPSSARGDLPAPALRAGLPAVVALLLAVVSTSGYPAQRDLYVGFSRFTLQRQVRAAQWIGARLPAEAVIAAHEVGALAYYSDRRVVDLAGRMTPALIDALGDPKAQQARLADLGVTHLAVMRDTFDLVNQTPLFRAPPEEPSAMEVFRLEPAPWRLTPPPVAAMAEQALQLVTLGQPAEAERLIDAALRLDPGASRAHLYAGRIALAQQRIDVAETRFRRALELHPGYPDAQLGLSEVALKRGQVDRAVAYLEEIIAARPDWPAAYGALARLYRTKRPDSAKAEEYERRYRRLSGVDVAEDGSTSRDAGAAEAP